MRFSRRAFLRNSAAAGVFLSALPTVARGASAGEPGAGRYGPLIPDPAGLLDLPSGFFYTVISETGQKMSDGLRTPSRPDGMACFEGPRPGTVTLVRNHENYWPDRFGSAFDENLRTATQVPAEMIYDSHEGGVPCPGGATTVVYDLARQRIVRSHLSLAGTLVNCAGGPTPWGSWLSCEEITLGTADGFGKDHGFVFEVPSSAGGLVRPVPLTAMGRFAHEAAAVDPVSHAIYLTEDEVLSLFYRFLPNSPGQLSDGGRLQSLVLDGDVPTDTRNWFAEDGGAGPGSFPKRTRIPVHWADVSDPLAREGEIRIAEAARVSAAIFSRGEGVTFALDNDGRSIFFTATEGGTAQIGQIWKYRPSPVEGTPAESDAPGTLELHYEINDGSVLEKIDNIAFAPWHDLILCEDGGGDNFLRGMTPGGRVYDIARNAHEHQSEFCGACFSPDGSTLFVNIQVPGFTLAITGPWDLVRGS